MKNLFLFFCLLLNVTCFADNLVNVGIILPLSGDAALVGQGVKNGIELGYKSLAPEVRERIKLHYEDDGLQSKNSISAFNNLKATKGIDFLINVSSGTGKALAPVAEQNKVTFLSVASDKTISENRKYVFNFWVTPEDEIRLALKEAQKRGYKKIAAVYSVQDGALALKQALTQLNNGQLEIVEDAEFDPAIRDFRPFLTKLRRVKDLDAIMVTLLPGQCGLFAKQVRQMGIKQDLFGIEFFEDANEVKASEGALLNQWYIQGDDPGGSFVSDYTKTYSSQSMWAASNGHDAMLLLAAALKEGYTPDKFPQFLSSVKDFRGALGTYSASGDNRFTLPATVKIVTKTGFEKLYKD